MTERIEGDASLRPEDTQVRHGVTEGKPVMTGVMPPADQPSVPDEPFADPKFTGNGGTWQGFEK